MWIKICGNTRLEDCLHAASSGADAVGFIFAPGKRTVTAEQIAPVVSKLPNALEKIGVFTTADASVIVSTVERAGLTGIQLHREYSRASVHSLRQRLSADGIDARIMQVLMWDADQVWSAQMTEFLTSCRRVSEDALADRLLIDTRTRKGTGGTGVTFDWDAVATALDGIHIPVIIAGGLSPENVAVAVRILHPYGVDVSSGVERAPGVKERAKVEAFIQNARNPT